VFSCGSGIEPVPEESQRTILSLFKQGEWRKAREAARQAGSRFPERSAEHWRFRALEARALVYARDPESAAALMDRPPPEGPAYCPARAWRAWVIGFARARKAAEGEPARRLLEEARALGASCPEPEAEIEAKLALARIAGQPAEAEALLLSALRQSEENRDEVQRMNTLLNLSALYLRQRRADAGLLAAEQARDLARRLGNPLMEARAAFNLASLHGDLGDTDNAIQVFRDLLPLLRRSSSEDEMLALGQLGLFLSGRGDGGEAVEPLRRALALARQRGHPDEIRRYATNLAIVLLGMGRIDEAAAANSEAERILAQPGGLGGSEYVGINRARIALARGDSRAAEAELRSIAARAGLSARLRWETHFRLAQVLRRERRLAEAFRHYESALALAETTRAAQGREESRISFQNTLLAFYAEYSDALIEAGQEDAAFAVEESSRARLLSDRTGGEVRSNPQRALGILRERARRHNIVFLAYWITPPRRHVRIVSGSGQRRVDLPVDAARLRRMVAEYRRQVELFGDPLAGSERLGRELHRTLIGPVEEEIPRGARVYLVPDGPLHALNFETLVVSRGSPRYWIEEATLAVVPSLTVLTERRSGPGRPGGALVIGDPIPSERGFRRLEHGAAEMRNVARHFHKATILAEEAATPAAFEQVEPRRFRYVHFTAHGKANSESPLDSYVVLSPSGGRGVLRVREIAAKPMEADLVTVSSCRGTGERSYAGEGMIGFAWGFQRAGARAVIAGLWDVNDRSTPAIMDKLYESIAAGHDPAQGLRLAKLAQIRAGGRYAKPFYWGPFQLYTSTF